MIKHRKLNEEVISCIITAFLDLLTVKDFDKISIIEIIERAGVSRNSFYRNFGSKEAILIRHIESITDEFIESASIPIFEVSWETYISAILNHMYKNRKLVDILVKNSKLYLISSIFDEAIYKKSSGKINEHHIWFLAGGLFNLYHHWVKDGYKETPEDIAETFSKSVLGI